MSYQTELFYITHWSFISRRARLYHVELVYIPESSVISQRARLHNKELVYITQIVYHFITQSLFISERNRLHHITQFVLELLLTHTARLYHMQLV